MPNVKMPNAERMSKVECQRFLLCHSVFSIRSAVGLLPAFGIFAFGIGRSPVSKHLHGQPAQALLADLHRAEAVRAADGPLLGERCEDHVLEGLAFAQRVEGVFGGHAVQDVLGRRVRRRREAARAIRTVKLNLHESPPWRLARPSEEARSCNPNTKYRQLRFAPRFLAPK